MPYFTVRPLAWREINKELDYLEEQAGLDTAERFLDQLTQSFGTLAHMPKMGVLCGFRKPATRRLRRWPVKDFENWLISIRYGGTALRSSTFSMERAILRAFWTISRRQGRSIYTRLYPFNGRLRERSLNLATPAERGPGTKRVFFPLPRGCTLVAPNKVPTIWGAYD